MKQIIISLLLLLSKVYSFAQIAPHSSCADAISITDGYTSGNIDTDGSGPLLDASSSVCGEDDYFETSDFYIYEFTTGSSSAGYYVDAEITSNISWQSAGIFSSCSGNVLSGCLDVETLTSAGTMSVGVGCGLTANTTYYLVVSRWDEPDGLDFEISRFLLKEFGTGTQANDECASATPIDLSTQYNGTTSACYTSSAQSHCWGSLDNDSWLEFTASAETVEFDYSITNCTNSTNGVQFAMYSSCGGTVISGSCDGDVTGTGTYTVSGLTPGTTYLFRIDGYASNICDYTLTPQGGVVTTPDNDECADAINLSCGGSATGSILLATDTDAPSGCGSLTPGKGIWYSFVGDGSNTTISTDNTGTIFDTEMFIYEGPCATLSACQSDDDGGSGTTSEITFLATNGTTYFVYIDGSGTSQGDFEISMSCASASVCDCATPSCPAEGLFTDIASTTPLPGVADVNCYDPDPDLGVGTYTTCHTVTSSADGTLGIIQGMSGVCVSDIIATRSAELYAVSAGSCTGSSIAADVAIANTDESSTFNPEWYSLTPNTDYVICVTFSINSGCSLDFACLDYYDADAGGAGNPFTCDGSIISNDFESGTGADGGWNDYNNSTDDLDWIRGTDATIDGTDLNGSDYLYIIDNSSNDFEQHIESSPMDLSNYCGVDISFYYMFDEGPSTDRIEVYWHEGDGPGSYEQIGTSITTETLTWTEWTFTQDLTTVGLDLTNIKFDIGYQDGSSSTAQNWAAIDNICIIPIESITNVSLYADGACSGNDATFTVSFDAEGGSGDYEVFNSSTGDVYGTASGGATDGTINISGTITGPTTASTITVDVREIGNNCSASDAPITINIPTCNLGTCTTILSQDFEGESTGNVSSTTGASMHQYGNDCDGELWEVVDASIDYGTVTCANCTGQWAEMENSACNQDQTLVSAQFTPNNNILDISFDYKFEFYTGTDSFVATLINVTDGGTTVTTLVSHVGEDFDGSYGPTTINLSGTDGSTDVYAIEFQYIGNDDFGASVDNIDVCATPVPTCDANAGTWN